MELPYERAAMRGEPMPKELGFVDSMMYQGLTWLYSRYRMGVVTREQAKAEKGRMLYWYDANKRKSAQENRMYEWHSTLMKETERIASEFAKTQTIDNALRLYDVINGNLNKYREKL